MKRHPDISPLKARFRNAFTELRYRQSTFRSSIPIFQFAFLLVALTSLFMIKNDLAFFPGSDLPVMLIALRTALAVVSFSCMLALTRVRSAYAFDAITFCWLMVLSSSLLVFNLSRPPDYQMYIVIDILLISAVYMVFVFNFMLQVLTALLLTFSSLYVAFVHKEFAAHALYTISFAFLLSNFIGVVIAARLHVLARVGFAQNQQLRWHAQKMTRIARIDPLTGLGNRRDYNDKVDMLFTKWTKHRQPFTLVIIDVDHFKRINDNYGHDMGDKVLKDLAKLLKLSARSDDHVYRYGGEEFVLLMNRSSQEQGEVFAERIKAQLSTKVFDEKHPNLRVTASFGVAEVAASDDCVRSLFHRADQALYIAKASGRDQVVVSNIESLPEPQSQA